MLQMFSLFQDDASLRTSNAIRRPASSKNGILFDIGNLPCFLWSLYFLFGQELYRHLSWIKDHEKGHVTGKRQVSLSSDMSLPDIKAKARALNITSISEYCLAAISVACYRVTDGKEKLPINLAMSMFLGADSPSASLKDFEPCNKICSALMSIEAKNSLQQALPRCR